MTTVAEEDFEANAATNTSTADSRPLQNRRSNPIITEESDDDDDDAADVSRASFGSIVAQVPKESEERAAPLPIDDKVTFSLEILGRPGGGPAPSRSEFDTTAHLRRGTGVLASEWDLGVPAATFAAGCNLLQLCAIGNLAAVQQHVSTVFGDVNFRDYDRRTALHVASAEGHLDVAQYLVERGAKVNRSDRWGGSPLDDAHRHRHAVVARYLRSKDAKTGTADRTAELIAAAAAGDIDEVKMLLCGSFDGKDGSTSRDALDFTLGDFVDINKGDYDRRTALHLAAGEGHADVVEFLCTRKADPNVEDRWGSKPLDDAVERGYDATATVLKRYGATRSTVHRSSSNLTNGDQVDAATAAEDDENLRVNFEELEMIERIGSGAFGEIYKCRWRGILVAAKCIKASKIQKEYFLKNRVSLDASCDRRQSRIEAIVQSAITDEEKQLALEDFRTETAIMRRLRHPNIVMMLGYSNSSDVEIMISELMKGSLMDVFKANRLNNTRMSKRTQIVYAQHLAQGMNHLHKCRPPIIHRDLKPANLLIDFSGTLKIADFGLAKIRPNPERCETKAFLMTGETGSYRYMAPEVFRHEEYSETVDVYSYAMIFYYLLQNAQPFAGMSGIDAVTKAAVDGERPLIPRDVDTRLSFLLKRCWDENPNARPSFEEIVRGLNLYSRDVFKTNDKEVNIAVDTSTKCSCIIS